MYVVAIAVEMSFVMECGGGDEDVERVYYCPEVRAHVEDHKVVRSVVPNSAERCCVEGSEVWFCGSKVSM